MAKDILFRISRPNEVFATKKVAAVVIPAEKGNVTILPERAPTMFLLGNGVVELLDSSFKPIERMFVKGGLADVARDRCAVSSEKVISVTDIDLAKAEEEREAAVHEEDKIFYQMVIDKLKLEHK